MLFKRLLVANRGEIAIRIFRAASELEIRTIAIYSQEDRFSLHRYKADEAYKIGTEGDPIGAYLEWKNLLSVAKRVKADAIHPGYGFLSENSEFAAACTEAGITFIGPDSKVLDTFGDKLKAKQAALDSNLPIIPGPTEPLKSVKDALEVAENIGYPVTLKAISGGGGKGIREVKNAKELTEAYERARSEAQTSFGNAEIYLEKTIVRPRHIEVQILGDRFGDVVHLYERDCSVQRRHQKIVEIAPARGLRQDTKESLYKNAVAIGKSVGYVGVGTVEFLVDFDETIYFLEVNPRIQVEHTITEMITGIDLVQASIIVAAGRSLKHPAIDIHKQSDIECRGVAIQCRVTTEDPKNNFAPDTGRIIAYRPPLGFGIRLDEGSATSGATVTPHYDSLLVKVIAQSRDYYGTARKMIRALREFRVRGVKHNIPLLINIVGHPDFIRGELDTSFLERHPELFEFPTPRDRATRLLKFIADATVNNPHGLPDKVQNGEFDSIELCATDEDKNLCITPNETAKSVYDKGGVDALVAWIKNKDKVLLTDTTMRDAHQSLFATRLRTRDMLRSAEFYRQCASGFFSLEVWGGATFDTSLRFLKEDPWERLSKIREAIPNSLLQMLLRGDNAVGYANYPEWVIRDFIKQTKQTGLDLFRIFDCLNNPAQMAIAIDEVKKQGGIAEACVCYTGNVASKNEIKYTLDYYVGVAKQLKSMGTDILCIKDMAGLMRPNAARLLIPALKEATGLPIHLHTHATSGNAESMTLAAAESGCDIIDGAISSMSGLTSQPSLNALTASLEDTDRSPEVSLQTLDKLGSYWEGVRTMYQAFDPGLKSTSTRVYNHEIPGGQYSNLFDQARKVGISPDEFFRLTELYKQVNILFGNIVKVTPSSKAVGDMALLLHKTGLDGETWLKEKPLLDYPDSVISFMRGHMGVPLGGFPKASRDLILGSKAPAPAKPVCNDGDSFDAVKTELEDKLQMAVSDSDVITYRLYPRVFLDFVGHKKLYGKVSHLPTPVFFYGLPDDREFEIDIEPGKTLIMSKRGISDANEKGERTVFFKLNGYPRDVKIVDENSEKSSAGLPQADPSNDLHVGAPMPGKVLELKVKVGQSVEKDEALIITESMKMEYVIKAKMAGKIKSVPVSIGSQVQTQDLLIEFEPS